MNKLRCWTIAIVLLASPIAQAYVFDFHGSGVAPGSDCPSPLPPQPLCIVFAATGVANDVPDVIPGTWNYSNSGMVLFFSGSGTWALDDPSPANNDLFGTFTNTLDPPDPTTGFATSHTHYVVLGGSGIFAGMTGFGDSIAFIAIAPPAAPPFFAFTEDGRFVVPEPAALALVSCALLALLWSRRRGR